MARKKPAGAPLPQESGLLLDLELNAPVAAKPVTPPAPKPRPKPEPVRAEDLAPAEPPPPQMRDERDHAVVTLGVIDNRWTVKGLIATADGELLDTFEAAGAITLRELNHCGWVMAACEAMRRCLAVGKPMAVELNLPDHFPVGFMIVTLPSRPQLASWDKATREKPWPELYQQFLDLKSQVNPRIRFQP